MPRVSICIPTYMVPLILRHVLIVPSLRLSGFRGAHCRRPIDDQSFQIAQAYAARDPRIRVASNKQNLGLAGNWNQCGLLAQGDGSSSFFKMIFLSPVVLKECLGFVVRTHQWLFARGKLFFEDDSKTYKRKVFCDISKI